MDLSATLLLPPILAALREIVKADHGGFFFCDPEGNILNLYAERMLSPQAMAHYYDQHFDAQQTGFKQSYAARVAAARPTSRHSMSAADQQTAYYREVLKPLGVCHFLYAVVRHAGTVLGQLSLYRNIERSAFTEADEVALNDVLHYLGKPLSSAVAPKPLDPSSAIAEESIALVNVDGQINFSDANWHRLMQMARGQKITPGQAAQNVLEMASFTQDAIAKTRAAPSQRFKVLNAWGEFRFGYKQLTSDAGETIGAFTLSRLSDQGVFVAQAAAELGLSVQQRLVVILLSQGKTNQEIGAHLGVSINTANYHVKMLLKRLGIHDRNEVVSAMRAALKHG
jgi:DNA-binding CsgD family transcriptional regulator